MLTIVGDSHTLAVDAGWRALSSTGAHQGRDVRIGMIFPGPLSLEPFFRCEAERITFLDEGTEICLESVTGRPFLCPVDRSSVFAFSLGLMTTILMRAWVRERFAPWSVSAAVEQQPLSMAVVEAIALAPNEHVISFFSRVTEMGIRCLSISAPPLSPNEPAFRECANPDVLFEVDWIARRTVAEALGRLGVGVVWPPDEAYVGAPGRSFLRPELGEPGDTHHGNAAYGRMMIERVLAQASSLRPWLLLRPLELGADPKTRAEDSQAAPIACAAESPSR